MGKLETKKAHTDPEAACMGLKYLKFLNRLDSSSRHNTQPATPKSKDGVGRELVCGKMSHRRFVCVFIFRVNVL